MKRIDIIVFPETLPSRAILVALTPLFQPLRWLQPVEDAQPGDDPLVAAAMAAGQCLLEYPLPLGRDRERFVHLLGELRLRRDDYARQLGGLSLAGLSSGAGRGKEQSGDIVSSLLRGGAASGADERALLLWQARLLLKLAEMQDEDEENLRRDLERINHRQDEMLAALRDEDDELEFSRTLAQTVAATAPPDRSRQRLKAWARMFAGVDPRPYPALLITSDGYAADRAIEEYTREQDADQPGLVLELPALDGDSQGFQERIAHFTLSAAPVKAKIDALLAGQGAAPGPDDLAAWSAALDECFPMERHGRTRLNLLAFAATDPARLLLKCFGRGEDEFLLADRPSPGTTWVGLLGEITRL